MSIGPYESAGDEPGLKVFWGILPEFPFITEEVHSCSGSKLKFRVRMNRQVQRVRGAVELDVCQDLAAASHEEFRR